MPHNAIPGLDSCTELLGLLRPYVRHCGNQRRPAWSIPDRRLLDYLLVYIQEGRGRFVIAGKEYQVQADDLFWIPPDTIHSLEGYAPSMVCPYLHFDLLYRADVSHWDFSIRAGMTDLAEFKPLMHPPVEHPRLKALCGRIRAHNNQRVGDLINEVCAEAARAQPYSMLRLSGLVLEILAEILRGQEGVSTHQNEHVPLLEQAAEHLRKHCEEEPSMADLADLCQLSPSYFRSLFVLHYGCPPRAYLRQVRIQKAKELMIGSGLNLSEIAEKLGFATVHSFSRAFRAVEGISPSEYRMYGRPSIRVEGRPASYSY